MEYNDEYDNKDNDGDNKDNDGDNKGQHLSK